MENQATGKQGKQDLLMETHTAADQAMGKHMAVDQAMDNHQATDNMALRIPHRQDTDRPMETHTAVDRAMDKISKNTILIKGMEGTVV
jgi:hypothetical protein